MAISQWLSSTMGWGKGTRLSIRNKILNDPYYRFQSLDEIAIAAQLGIAIEVNRASIDDWLRLPGISIHQARTLVELVGMGVQLLSVEDIASAIAVPVQRLKPLVPVLAFSYYDTESLLAPQRINPSTASVEQLAAIPLLDDRAIARIISDREQNGTYRNLVDFQRRLAFDSHLIAQLMHYLQF